MLAKVSKPSIDNTVWLTCFLFMLSIYHLCNCPLFCCSAKFDSLTLKQVIPLDLSTFRIQSEAALMHSHCSQNQPLLSFLNGNFKRLLTSVLRACHVVALTSSIDVRDKKTFQLLALQRYTVLQTGRMATASSTARAYIQHMCLVLLVKNEAPCGH